MADFFSKMKKGISKSATAISVKSSTAMEINKIKGEISGLKKEKTDNFTGIGTKIYTMNVEGNIDLTQIAENLQRLAELDAAIADKERAIEEAIKKKEEDLSALEEDELAGSTIICSCGAQLNENTKFCPKCGKKVEELVEEVVEEPVEEAQEAVEEVVVEEVVEEPTTITCECGAILNKDAVFCPQCGKKQN